MCSFFSFVTDSNQKEYYFDWQQRQALMLDNPKNYEPDSHTSICDFYGLKDDKVNKFEFDPITGKFTTDQINLKHDNSEIAENFVRKLDFKTIVKPLIIKPIVDPFKIKAKKVSKHEIDLLEKWIESVNCLPKDVSVYDLVYDLVYDSVWASVGYSVRNSVWASVWASVGNLVCDSVSAYVASFFDILYDIDLTPAQELWELGFVPSFDGTTWRLHNANGVVYERNVNYILKFVVNHAK